MKIVLFDIDDTLISNPPKSDQNSSRKMFKKVFNLDAHENMIFTYGKTEKGIILEILNKFGQGLKEFEDVENKAYQIWAQEVEKILKINPPKLLPGIKKLLEELSKEKDIILGLLTGNSRLRAQVKLSICAYFNFFKNESGVLKGAFGEISAQRSDLIDEAKRKLGEGVYVILDDSLIAGKMTKERSLPAILVATGGASITELKEYSPFVFENFDKDRWKEVVKIIKEL